MLQQPAHNGRNPYRSYNGRSGPYNGRSGIYNGVPSNTPQPSLVLDFVNAPTAAMSWIAFTRATSAWYFSSGGVLTDAGSGNPRFDYNPSTLAANGIELESASTNGIRNAVAAGSTSGVIGSGGAAPTNWTFQLIGTSGLTRTVVGTGTEDGIPYVDLKLSGTSIDPGSFQILFEAAGVVAGTVGQVFSNSVFWRLVGGSLTGISAPTICINEFNGGVSYLGSVTTAVSAPTSAALRTQRRIAAQTLAQATTASINSYVEFTLADATVIDCTLRIAVPQLELKGVATSPILSAGAATPRNIDRPSITDLTSFGFNSAQGTLVARVAVGLPASGGNQFIARFSDNTYDNTIALNINSTGYPQLSTISGGTNDGNASNGTILVANTFTTIACSWQSGRLEISQNGSAVASDTSFTFPTGMTRLDIGSDHAGLNAFITGWEKFLRYYPQAITGVALQQLASLT